MTQYLLLDFDRPSHGIGQVVQSDQNVQPPRDQKKNPQTNNNNKPTTTKQNGRTTPIKAEPVVQIHGSL